MKIRIEDNWYDSKDVPMAVKFEPVELEAITGMAGKEGGDTFASFPDSWTDEDSMIDWMSTWK